MRSADDINSVFAHYTDFPGYWGGLGSLALPTGSFTQVAGMGAFNAVQFNQATFNQSSEEIETESHFYLFDLQASNRLLLDTNAAKDNEYLYKGFGKKVLSTGTTRNPFQFQGQVGPYFDANNRTWMRARIYNPITGRWFSQDPIEFEGEDWNLYRFVESQPVNNNDPSGLYSKRELFNAWFCYLKRRLAYDNKTICCLTNRRVNSHFNCENPINYKIECLAENNQNVPPWWPKNVPPPKLPTECQKRNANCDSCQSHFYNECLKKKARGACRQIATGCEILCNSSWDGWKIAACWKGIKKAIPKE